MSKIRLSKALAAAGVASRRASEDLIFDGFVEVNGEIITVPQTLVDPKMDTIHCKNKRISTPSSFVYYKLNKPSGFVCSHKRLGNERLIYELLGPQDTRLFCVGRLDKDTEGLILITNDGHFSNEVIHPSSNIEKEYIATVDTPLSPAILRKISRGTIIDDVLVKPQKVEQIAPTTLRVIVKEGKKREVRKFIESVSLQVLSLKRVRIGGLSIGKLRIGHFEPLSEDDRKKIFHPG